MPKLGAMQHSVTYHGTVTLRLIFTTLYGMQTWSSDDNSGCPSIRLFDKHVNCDKNGRKICPDFYTIRKTI